MLLLGFCLFEVWLVWLVKCISIEWMLWCVSMVLFLVGLVMIIVL